MTAFLGGSRTWVDSESSLVRLFVLSFLGVGLTFPYLRQVAERRGLRPSLWR